jgi:epsilon-lactone hydrolase
MEIDPYYEPCVFLEETIKADENISADKNKKTLNISSAFNFNSGWFIVKSEDYFFPQNVSEEENTDREGEGNGDGDVSLARGVFGYPGLQSVHLSAAATSLQALVPTFRKRPSWNSAFTSMVTTLRLVGKNPLLSTLSISTLQLLTDQLSIPSWLPTLPPGVSSTLSLHPSGEWFFPTLTGLKIRKNAQPDCMRGRYILYVHGGAFCCCHTGTHRGLLHGLVHQTGASILSVNYRRPPEHPYPTPVHDCLSAYLFLLEKVGDSRRIFFAGDSAGGNLVINTLILAAQHGLPPPAGAVLLSPWVDLTDNGRTASWEQYSDVDYLSPDLAEIFARSYAGDSQEVQSLSPLYSSLLHLLPPLLVEFGQCEVLHDQILAFCEAARAAGVELRHCAREDMVHVFPIYAVSGMRQCQDAFDEIIAFFDEISARHHPQESGCGDHDDDDAEKDGDGAGSSGSRGTSSMESDVLVEKEEDTAGRRDEQEQDQEQDLPGGLTVNLELEGGRSVA